MRWKGKSREQRDRESLDYESELRKWHPSFALWPTHTIDGPWVWLTKVDRRLRSIGVLGSYFFEYREKQAGTEDVQT